MRQKTGILRLYITFLVVDGKQKQMTLSVNEFIRRFEQHILPKRFTKIRTYGYVANRNRHQRINEVLSRPSKSQF